jgi:hypothetical protein
MIGYLQMQYRILRLQWQQGSLARHYRKEIKEARESMAPRDSVSELEQRHQFEELGVIDDIHREHTKYLMGLAQRLMVPTPDIKDGEKWERSSTNGYYILKREGIKELRSAIRAERKEQREMYLPFMATAIGIIGSLTGLVAVFIKTKGG